jgi:hypothetical protein
MARRHVSQAEEHVRAQRTRISRLREDRHPTALAEELLDEFERTLRDHRSGLGRVLEEQRLGLRDEGGELIPQALYERP